MKLRSGRRRSITLRDGTKEMPIRMERALHPELAKRMVSPDSRGISRLNQMSAMTLVQNTKAGGGTHTPKTSNRSTSQSLTASTTLRLQRSWLLAGWIIWKK